MPLLLSAHYLVCISHMHRWKLHIFMLVDEDAQDICHKMTVVKKGV